MTKALAKQDGIKGLLKANHQNITAMLPPQLPAAKFMRTVANAVMKNPKLLDANQDSLVLSILNAAGAGLEPDGSEAALVPYKGKVQFQPMFQGLIKLARQSGEISTIYPGVVREGDEFTYKKGLHPVLDHTPAADSKYGTWSHVYAVAHMKDGGYQFEVMTRPDVMRIKAKAPFGTSASSPWQSDEEAMAIKTVLKQLCKFLPKSTELQRAIEADNAAEMGKPFDIGAIELVSSEPVSDDNQTTKRADKDGGLV